MGEFGMAFGRLEPWMMGHTQEINQGQNQQQTTENGKEGAEGEGKNEERG